MSAGNFRMHRVTCLVGIIGLSALTLTDSKLVPRQEFRTASGFRFLAQFCFLPASDLSNNGNAENNAAFMWNDYEVKRSGFSFDIFANATDDLHLAVYFRGKDLDDGK